MCEVSRISRRPPKSDSATASLNLTSTRPAGSVTQHPTTMRAILLITLLSIYHTKATLDLNKIQEVATLKLQTVSDHATQTIQKITDNIDLEKIKQLDFLNIIPRIQDRLSHIQGKKEAVAQYLMTAKDMAGKEVIVAYESIPWPVHRMGGHY